MADISISCCIKIKCFFFAHLHHKRNRYTKFKTYTNYQYGETVMNDWIRESSSQFYDGWIQVSGQMTKQNFLVFLFFLQVEKKKWNNFAQCWSCWWAASFFNIQSMTFTHTLHRRPEEDSSLPSKVGKYFSNWLFVLLHFACSIFIC